MQIHADVPGFGAGFIGVDLFFVISGYVITCSLLREVEKTGTFSWPEFLSRRVKRLLPASFACIALTALGGHLLLPPDQQIQNYLSCAAAATWWANMFFGNISLDYFHKDLPKLPTMHFWSLSLEEQFYLLWPLALFLALLLTRTHWRLPTLWWRSVAEQTDEGIELQTVEQGWYGGRKGSIDDGTPKATQQQPNLLAAVAGQQHANTHTVFLVTGLCILFGSFAYCIYITPTGSAWAYFSLLSRAWQLVAGCLLSLFSPRHLLPLFPTLSHDTWRTVTRVGRAVSGVCVCVCLWWIHENATALYPGWRAILPTAAAWLWIAVGAELPASGGVSDTEQDSAAGIPGPLGEAFYWLGDRSYSVYLWHWPAIILARAARAALPTAHGGGVAAHPFLQLTGSVQGMPLWWPDFTVCCWSLLPALLSYRLLETPTRRLQTGTSKTISAGIFGSLAIAGVCVLMAGRVRSDIANASKLVQELSRLQSASQLSSLPLDADYVFARDALLPYRTRLDGTPANTTLLDDPSVCPATHPFPYTAQGKVAAFCCSTQRDCNNKPLTVNSTCCEEHTYMPCAQPPCTMYFNATTTPSPDTTTTTATHSNGRRQIVLDPMGVCPPLDCAGDRLRAVLLSRTEWVYDEFDYACFVRAHIPSMQEVEEKCRLPSPANLDFVGQLATMSPYSARNLVLPPATEGSTSVPTSSEQVTIFLHGNSHAHLLKNALAVYAHSRPNVRLLTVTRAACWQIFPTAPGFGGGRHNASVPGGEVECQEFNDYVWRMMLDTPGKKIIVTGGADYVFNGGERRPDNVWSAGYRAVLQDLEDSYSREEIEDIRMVYRVDNYFARSPTACLLKHPNDPQQCDQTITWRPHNPLTEGVIMRGDGVTRKQTPPTHAYGAMLDLNGCTLRPPAPGGKSGQRHTLAASVGCGSMLKDENHWSPATADAMAAPTAVWLDAFLASIGWTPGSFE